MTKQKQHWLTKQKKDAEKVFAPKIMYDEEHDILYISWYPQLKYDYSIETQSGFVFDISKKPDQEVKGVEIFDFLKKLKQSTTKK